MNEINETSKEAIGIETMSYEKLMIEFGKHLAIVQKLTVDIDVNNDIQDKKYVELLNRWVTISHNIKELAVITTSLSLRQHYTKKT